MLNSPNMTLSFTGPPPVECGGGRQPGSSAPAPQDCSTSEAFFPRTVLAENISRCVQHILQHFPTTMPFPTTSRISFSCQPSAASQVDSWWLGHVEPDDVMIAVIGGQALDIYLHGPVCAQEWHCKDIHSHIHSHPPMHTPKRKRNKRTRTKYSTHRTWRFRLLVVFLSYVVVGDGQEARHLLLRTVQLRRPSFLEQYW